MSVDALLRTYQQDVDKKRVLVRRAEAARSRLLFITEALRDLFADEGFVNLARAEALHTMPRGMDERIRGEANR